jgi:hypothetical protein
MMAVLLGSDSMASLPQRFSLFKRLPDPVDISQR